MLGDHLLCLKMADFLNIFAALEQDECEITSCTIPDSNDDIILLAAVACFMRRELTRVNGYFEVTIPAYLSGEFENHFRMTRETCQLCSYGRHFCECPCELTLGRETKTEISCEWNTKFSIIPEIPLKRVHSKRIPKFSKTFTGIFTVPFSFICMLMSGLKGFNFTET